MSPYTYTLYPDKKKTEPNNTYRKKELEKMTTFQLREICRKERLAASTGVSLNREGYIRLIMRFRGQKDYRCIREYCEGGMERLQQVLDRNSIHVSDENKIRIPGSIAFYMDMAMDELDSYQAESDSISLYESNLLLVDENYQIYTCLYLKEVDGRYWISKGRDIPILPLEKHQYSVLYFPSERVSEYFYDKYNNRDSTLPGNLSCIRIHLLDVELRQAQETQLPLVIDFGSCNTTMGIRLPDGSVKIAESEKGNVIPSVIGISGIHGDKIDYVFGNEAVLLNQNNYLDQDIPVFYDIKRWVSNPDRVENIILDNGIKVLVSRRDMLKAFFNYLFDMARKQFKCQFLNVQMLAPIRQKEKFRELFTQMLPEFMVDCSLDEGMAVLFSSIDRLIANGNYEQDRWYHALIIDCGGGTTDLTSGRFRIHSGRVSYHVDLETSYENGDTNFGGNNLTYRILQLLKIRICQFISNGRAWKDDKNDGSFYEMLEDAYKTSEEILPTRFTEYLDKRREDYFYVKNNYYYLFELAEQIKKLFFQSGFRYELWIGTNKTEKEQKGDFLFLDKWKLSVRENKKFIQFNQEISFPLYLYQIEELLRPDIYRLMERFLKHKFMTNELQTYEMIKLTGQSCKSRLFEEALKEYVPGILIQNSRKDQDGTELKMCCLEGALSYFYNCKLGYMKVDQVYQVGALPYEIVAYTHEGKPKVLVRSLDREGHIGCISRFMIGKQLDIYLNDESKKHLKTYCFECDMGEFERTTQEEINHEYAGTVIQEETDTIMEGEMKFFVWVSRNQWGFMVLPILREGELLYKGKETFFDFEDDTWEENFFDGRK